MYQFGVPKTKMRVSALIHETSWHSIEMLQEFEIDTYNKFLKRVSGVSTINHAFDEMDNVNKVKLPFMFKDWKEYRDYLLVNLVKPEYHGLFNNRWKNQNDDVWYQVHIQEILWNDIDGTINANASARIRKEKKKGVDGGKNVYFERQKEQFIKFKDKKNKL